MSVFSIVAQRTLSDIRDGKNYTVRKLADGKCWITNYLAIRLESGTSVVASNADGGKFDYTPTVTPGLSSTADYYLYNYDTATAGKREMGSICAENWHVPTEGQMRNLYDTYGNLANMKLVPVDIASEHDVWTSTSGVALNVTGSGDVSSRHHPYYCGGTAVWCNQYNSNASAYAVRCANNLL